MDDPLALLRTAVEQGTPVALAAWAVTGRDGILALREALTRRDALGELRVHPRDAMDNLMASVAAIAPRSPADFLDLFASAEFDRNTFVLCGFGWIDDPRATSRLVGAAGFGDEWVRMEAAIGLGRRRSPAALAALVGLLGDPQYLVRYHALRGLRTSGDESALPALRAFNPPSELERRLAREAIEAIESRRSTRGQSTS